MIAEPQELPYTSQGTTVGVAAFTAASRALSCTKSKAAVAAAKMRLHCDAVYPPRVIQCWSPEHVIEQQIHNSLGKANLTAQTVL